jgi:hypothetical protein
MVRRSAVLVFLLFMAQAIFASCPELAPTKYVDVFVAEQLWFPVAANWFGRDEVVDSQKPLRFLLSPVSPCLNCAYGTPYSIQPCDKVTWRFGDGEVVVKNGEPVAEHIYRLPVSANLDVTVTIENALGRIDLRHPLVVSAELQSPATLCCSDFYSTKAQLEVRESNRTVLVPVTRTNDVTTHVSAVYDIYSLTGGTSGVVEFPPGVTVAWIPVSIVDDRLSSWPASPISIHFRDPAGGLVIPDELRYYGIHVDVIDDEPFPTMSFSNVEVLESAGVARIPVRVDVPLDSEIGFTCYIRGTATQFADYKTPGPFPAVYPLFPACQTTGYIEIPIVDDAAAEPAETISLTCTAHERSGDSWYSSREYPQIVNRNVTVTILDDDSPPRRQSARH